MSGPMMRVTEKAQATATARAVLDILEIRPDQLHKLADVPLEQLLAVQNGVALRADRLPGGFGPMLDGKVISQHPFGPDPAPYVAHIPLLIGQNRDEATFFNWENPKVFKMDDAAMVARLRSQTGRGGCGCRSAGLSARAAECHARENYYRDLDLRHVGRHAGGGGKQGPPARRAGLYVPLRLRVQLSPSKARTGPSGPAMPPRSRPSSRTPTSAA